VQYHPTALPGSGILITEGCRGEGGYLVNKDGHRYLQDYNLGPLVSEPTPKTMELGPRDRLSQAFWHEERAERTVATPLGNAVHLELMHLGRAKLHERLPMIYELAQTFLGIDPAEAPIPVCPAVHYTMGGIATDSRTATALPGLYACGECSSVGIHGANRLGSNSLAELCVFGRVAGEEAARFAREAKSTDAAALTREAEKIEGRAVALLTREDGRERIATLRDAMGDTMEEGVGIFRSAEGMQASCDRIAELKDRYACVHLDDRTRSFNTEWLTAIELGFQLEVAEAMAWSALERQESRGAHKRLDQFGERDDQRFLQHTLAFHQADGPPRLDYQPVNITRLPPAERVYGGAAKKAAAAVAGVGR
jgi:fumarate reductase flavoprotein subunit